MLWQHLYIGAAFAFFLVAFWMSGGGRTSTVTRFIAASCCAVVWPVILVGIFVMVLVTAFGEREV